MAVDDTFQHRMIFRHTLGQNAISQRHFRVTITQGTPPTPTEIGNSIEQALLAALTACMASAWVYKGWKMRYVYPTPTQLLPQTHADVPGVLVGESLPPQVAQVISLRASSAPPRSRGRMYVPCCTESESGSGVPLAAQITRLSSLGDALLQTITVNGAQGGTCTIRCGIWPTKAGVFFYPFTTRVVRTSFGTQRRRSALNRSDAPEF